jgi:3,4-dihydroxy 2-butanone 4-phosphate synthase/GTP cyclohydrolase II
MREFGIGAQILVDQGVRQLKVIAGGVGRIRGVEGYGLRIVDHLPIPPRNTDDPSMASLDLHPEEFQ